MIALVSPASRPRKEKVKVQVQITGECTWVVITQDGAVVGSGMDLESMYAAIVTEGWVVVPHCGGLPVW